MSFEDKTTEELLRIVKAGLGFTLQYDQVSTDALCALETAAAESGARITLVQPIYMHRRPWSKQPWRPAALT